MKHFCREKLSFVDQPEYPTADPNSSLSKIQVCWKTGPSLHISVGKHEVTHSAKLSCVFLQVLLRNSTGNCSFKQYYKIMQWVWSACVAMPLNLMRCYALHRHQTNKPSCRTFTGCSAKKFVLTGVHLHKKQYTGKTIQSS